MEIFWREIGAGISQRASRWLQKVMRNLWCFVALLSQHNRGSEKLNELGVIFCGLRTHLTQDDVPIRVSL